MSILKSCIKMSVKKNVQLFTLIFFFFSVRTPGGKLVYQYLKKPKKIPRCGQCKEKLRGIIPARPMERSRMCLRKKTVKRAYGGVLCHKCVKERIVRAFLLEEHKIVVKALKAQQQSMKSAPVVKKAK